MRKILVPAIAVVAVGVVVVVSPIGKKDTKPFTAAEISPVAGPLKATSATTAGKLVCNGAAVDAERHYYVLTSAPQCGEPGPTILARTTDGGEHWTTWQLPDKQAPSDRTARVINAQTLVLRGLLTRDGGASWAVAPADGPPLAQVPAGWPIFGGAGSTRLDADGIAVAQTSGQFASDPATGRLHLLARQPSGLPLIRATTDTTFPATDGSLWACAQTGRPVVGVSRDRGRSWRPAAPPGEGGAEVSVASLDGRVAYALAVSDPGTPDASSVLSRTDDGGASWHQVSAGKALPKATIQVATDSSVLGVDDASGRILASSDGGRTFTAMSGISGVAMVLRTPAGGYAALGLAQDGSDTLVATSADGVRFSPAQRPPGSTLPAA